LRLGKSVEFGPFCSISAAENPRNYSGYRAVLIRLDASPEDAREFLIDSWLLAAPKKLARSLDR
jgi:hypothetical protein